MYTRYVILFLLTGLGGLLSGLFWLVPNGLMGAVLAMSLSAGTLWLGMKQRRDGVAPSDAYAACTGAVVGLLGGVVMAALAFAWAGMRRYDFSPPILPLWAPVVMGVLYGIVLLWCYQRRLTSRRPVWATLGRACGLCFVLKAMAASLYMGLFEHGPRDVGGMLIGATMLSLLGAVPFAFFWVLATAKLDPAWRAPQPNPEPMPAVPLAA